VTPPLARLSGVVRRFGPVTALDGAELEVRPGEVHGVLGENGAGKSTLLGILGGMLRPDEGVVEIEGEVRELATPRDAWAAGVGLVHQHFTLVPTLSVLENLALGHRRAAGGFALPLAELQSEVSALSERTGLEVPLEAPVEALGVGSRQRVEILKALLRSPRILVLDEPTAVLTPPEVERLFDLLRELAAEGRGVVLVAHKLDEILGVADAVTVLHQGRTVLQAPRDQVDADLLTRAMVGTDGGDPGPEGREGTDARGDRRDPSPPGEVVARLEDVHRLGARGEEALAGVSLEVRRGEILGVAGVEGNGQRELSRILAGRDAPDEGRRRIPTEVAFIPQDRTHEGVVQSFDLVENTALTLQRTEEGRRGPWLRWSAVRERTEELMERFDVRAPGPATRASSLSGGNQQRLVVARELEMARDLVVAENPTRGLDVTSAAFVHDELRRLVAEPGGPGVVLVSTDLDEVLALSHRILVLVRGRLSAVPAGEATREGVGGRMLARGRPLGSPEGRATGG